mgnify:CR=1 FL=1
MAGAAWIGVDEMREAVSRETIERIIDDLETKADKLKPIRHEWPRADTAFRAYEYAADELRKALQDG